MSAQRVFEWAELTGPRLQALDREKTVVTVSCSPLEVHGPHLPTMADVREAQGLLDRACELLFEQHEDLTVVRLPWLWVAADVLPHVGSVKFSPQTVRAVLRELGTSLARQGFRHIWVSNFHGGPRHILAIEQACSDVHRRTGAFMLSVFSMMVKRLTGGSSDAAALLDGIGGLERKDLVGDTHGGLVETSILLHLEGAHVDPTFTGLERRSIEHELSAEGKAPLQRGGKATVRELLRSLPIRQRYWERQTYAGDPARGTAELGKLYLDFYARHAAEVLSKVWKGELPYRDTHSPLWPLRHAFLSPVVGQLFEALFATRPSPV
ncbi:MAG: creatininase family protein [Myxococcaceae bacterium]|nr:creatininase family protein [Myxococcaceae bacterium]